MLEKHFAASFFFSSVSIEIINCAIATAKVFSSFFFFWALALSSGPTYLFQFQIEIKKDATQLVPERKKNGIGAVGRHQ